MQLGTSLRRRTRIEEDLILLPDLVNRDVTVTEDDEVGVWKSTVQAPGPAPRCAAVMNKCYANSSQLEHPSLLQDSHEVMVVVAEHCIGLDHGPQFLKSLSGRDISGVEHDVRFGHSTKYLISYGLEPG